MNLGGRSAGLSLGGRSSLDARSTEIEAALRALQTCPLVCTAEEQVRRPTYYLVLPTACCLLLATS